MDCDKNLKALLYYSIGIICLIYAYFFLILPQSWSLNNDYGWLLDWRDRREFWRRYFDLNQAEMGTGRFHPVYDFYIVCLYYFLPLKPVVFRVCQFLLLGYSVCLLNRILNQLKFSTPQILLAILLFLGNLTIKDWITLPAAFEPVAIVFFLLSLVTYLDSRKIISALFFFFSFLSKETFFILLPTFFLLEYFFDYIPSKNKIKAFVTLAIFSIPTLIFIFFVKSLDRVYTANKFTAFPIKNILVGFLAPPLKAFFPALFLLAFLLWKNKKQFTQGEKKALVIGSSIIFFQTVILALWGPFDSWFYLHMAIPIGWALVIASVFADKSPRILLGLTCFYLIALTFNGSYKLWNYLAAAPIAASMACEDFEKNPNLQIFSNCEEGSVQLRNYLVAYDVCKNPPNIKWTGQVAENERPTSNFEVLLSTRCNGPLFPVTLKSEVKLPFWTIQKF